MKVKIKDIAIIQTGLFAKPVDTGDVVYLQVKHFDEFGSLNTELHGDLNVNDVAEKHFLKGGDVLFAAKGSKNFATVYEDHNPKAVASTSFFVLRLLNNNVLSEYLAWFLNSNNIQSILKAKAKGSSMPSISKQVLEDLEISIPTHELQRIIISISNLRIKEKSIQEKLKFLRDKLIQLQIVNAINL